MTVTITPDDLEPFAPGISEDKAEAMIEDALALAYMVAPCLAEEDLDPATEAAAKAILRGAILRWNESGQGGVSQLTALGFGQTFDNRVDRKAMYQPAEIEALQKLCADPAGDYGKAWSYDTLSAGSIHDQACSLNFGATYCSCGADIAGYPIYGVGVQ
jgi:hypothetical protein